MTTNRTAPVARLPYIGLRQAAARAFSKGLSPQHRGLLDAASAGQEVDVVVFRDAAQEALVNAASRSGDEAARKAYAAEALHLVRWADGVLAKELESAAKAEARWKEVAIGRRERLEDRTTKLLEVGRERDELREQLATAQLDVRELRGINDRSEQIEDHLRKRIDLLEQEVEELKSEAAHEDERLGRYAEEANTFEDENRELLRLAEVRDAALAQAQKDLGNADDEIEVLIAENGRLQSLLFDAEAAAPALDDRVAVIVQWLAEVVTERNELRGRLEELRKAGR